MAFYSVGEIFDEFIRDLERGAICTTCIHYATMRGDSVLEEAFWKRALKSNGGWHGSADQFQIGQYRVDSIFDCDGKAVVIELDGRAYHDREADHYRDKFLVQHVSAVVRVPFAAMWYYPDATFRAIGEWFPRLRTPDPYTVVSGPEVLDEYRRVQEEESCCLSDYTADVEDLYQVWALDGDIGYVGSPNSFLHYGTKQVISVQRGNTATGIVDRIYSQVQRNKAARSIHSRQLAVAA